MSDLLAGLGDLGLENIAAMDLYEKPKKEQESEKGAQDAVLDEKEIIYDRTYECPVCDSKITSKTVKSGKAKLLRTDLDLRPVHEGIDMIKYDVVVCPHCGFAALTRYSKNLTDNQIKLIKQHISPKVKFEVRGQDTIGYEEASQRYQLALANAIVKKTRASEKAYICLKSAWLFRGWQESLEEGNAEAEAQRKELAEKEEEFLKNAFEGFVSAVQAEGFPMCGMDEITVNYLLAVLAMRFKKYDISSKMISSILISPAASPRMKDKTRELKEIVFEEMKKNK